MNPNEFEYAVKQDIRNNPIVREVDQTRQRELWRSLAIGVVLVAVLLFSAWQHFELLRHGYRKVQMQQERVLELETNRHLRLEIETLQSPKRIERIATEELNLVAPSGDQAVVIQRVAPAPPPDRAIVATRQEPATEGGSGGARATRQQR